MKKKITSVVLLALTLIAETAFSKDFLNNGSSPGYQIDMVRPGGDRPCTLFTLIGVPTVDSNSGSNSPWFVIEHSTPEYNQMVATLLMAKASGRPVQVTTTGALSSTCGQHNVVWYLLAL